MATGKFTVTRPTTPTGTLGGEDVFPLEGTRKVPGRRPKAAMRGHVDRLLHVAARLDEHLPISATICRA